MRNFLTIFLEYLALLNSTKSSEKQRKKLNKNTILKTQVTLFVPGKEQIKTKKKGPAEDTLLPYNRIIFQDSLGYFKRKQATY